MLIGIDANEANVVKRVGISEVAYWMLYYFAKFRHEDKDSSLDYQIYLKNQPLSVLPSETDYWHYKVFGPKPLWTQFALPVRLFLQKPRPDVFFSLTHYAPRFSPVPTVVSVMDLAYLYYPQNFRARDLQQLRSWTAYSVKKASKVITISNSSRNDIIKEYGLNKEKVVTVYPGIKQNLSLAPHIYGMNEIAAKYHLSKHFILFVGTIQPRKNIKRLIEAFEVVLRSKNEEARSKDLELIIIGKKGWLYEEILETPKKLGIEERVKFLHSVPDDELKIFYQHALCYVLPSLYEGFGLPVLEAMQYNCPGITSNVSSLPEAGGDAALYVDPEDVEDIAAKIVQLISNEQLRKELIAKGKEQTKKFSWEKSARQALEVLEEVVKG